MFKTIILVALHQGDSRFLERKLQNLLEQTYIGFAHVVFLNNMDYDGIADRINQHIFINRYSATQIVFSEPTKLYETWNKALTEFRSEYVINFNSDDLWSNDYLEQCIKTLDGNPDINIVTAKILITDLPNQKEPWTNIVGEITPAYPFGTLGPSVMARRWLFDKYGLYRTDLTVAGDAEVWRRWHKEKECKYFVIQKPSVLYLTRPDSLERRRDTETGLLYADIDSGLVNGPQKNITTRIPYVKSR